MKRRPGLTGPLILLALGFILLFNNLGLLSWDIWSTLWRFWPVILILLGLEILVSQTQSSIAYALMALLGVVVIIGVIVLALIGLRLPPWLGPVTTQHVSHPLGAIKEARVELDFTDGELIIGSYSGTDKLLDGRLAGRDVNQVAQRYREEDGRAVLELSSPSRRWAFFPFGPGDRGSRWELNFTNRVPLTLVVDAGAGRTYLDLRDLNVRELEFNAGVGETTILFPRSGQTVARVDGGVGAITLEIPGTMPARITVDTGIGDVNIDRRFQRRGDGVYETAGFSREESYLELEVDVGVGSVTVR
jgi:hypothetical protein